ncbi:AAA family ATPase [Methanocella arvoryzae]|uniref:ATPase (AAA superfamily) n=1 Tax=Methanocella arvoryzae (strain DSM 22066 / NBRC 105507 / MRE50) TaxID=351160 RepID=Q0W1J7_METAR|nr:MoxR family ATPase [Methanocella arvoryzae]CAJ37746.1 putative ATPase (AAA superfamily) [Methanocella arvoryzae MRE50]
MVLFKRDDIIKIIETCQIKGQDEAIIRALMYLNLGYPIMLYGPPGNGKTTIAEHILRYASRGDDYYRMEATEGMTEYHTIGGFHPLSMSGNAELSRQFIYKDGIVTRALQENKNLLIDEFTRAPATAYSGLFMLLSTGVLHLEYRELTLQRPKDWVLVVTANLGDEGTFKMSAALKRRFIPIFIGYTSRFTEEKIIKSYTPGLQPVLINAILDFAEETRRLWQEEKSLPQGLSTDGVIKMARYCDISIEEGLDAKTAFIDSAMHQGVIIADETDYVSLQTVNELALKIASRL